MDEDFHQRLFLLRRDGSAQLMVQEDARQHSPIPVQPNGLAVTLIDPTGSERQLCEFWGAPINIQIATEDGAMWSIDRVVLSRRLDGNSPPGVLLCAERFEDVRADASVQLDRLQGVLRLNDGGRLIEMPAFTEMDDDHLFVQAPLVAPE
jgi:hypothetical protein